MGFLKPGKNIKKRRLNQESPHFERNSSPSKKCIQGISSHTNINLSSRTSTPSSPPTLDSLPVEILQAIFVYSGPGNNLPLLNKHLNHLLRFDPRGTGLRWHNVSVALEMARRWYLVDPNSRIDFGLVHRKLNYYRRKVEEILVDWIASGNEGEQIQRDQVFRAVNTSIDSLASTITVLMSNDKFLLESIFQNRFITQNVLSAIGNYPILGEEDAFFEVRDRFKFIRLKFKEIFTRVYELVERLNSGEICTATSPRKLELSELEAVDEVVNDENELLPDFDDERLTVTSWMKSSSTRTPSYQYEEEGYTFKLFNYDSFRDFPPRFYKGISDKSTLDWIKTLHQSYSYNYMNVDFILQNTLKTYTDRIMNMKTNETSLRDIAEFIVKPLHKKEDDGERTGAIPETGPSLSSRSFTERPIIQLLKLYHNHENIDCTRFGTNYKNDSLPEDLSKSLLLLLTEFYLNGGDDTGLWLCVVELKNFNLAQVLMKFNKNPVIDFLHDIM